MSKTAIFFLKGRLIKPEDVDRAEALCRKKWAAAELSSSRGRLSRSRSIRRIRQWETTVGWTTVGWRGSGPIFQFPSQNHLMTQMRAAIPTFSHLLKQNAKSRVCFAISDRILPRTQNCNFISCGTALFGADAQISL